MSIDGALGLRRRDQRTKLPAGNEQGGGTGGPAMPFATNAGVNLHYRTEGAGPPLFIQHAFTDSAETWYELGYVDALKEAFRLILLDARGHGNSDKPHESDAYSWASMAGDVLAVLDAEDLPTVHYLGYSMGS